MTQNETKQKQKCADFKKDSEYIPLYGHCRAHLALWTDADETM